jgi:hypothetical protein
MTFTKKLEKILGHNAKNLVAVDANDPEYAHKLSKLVYKRHEEIVSEITKLVLDLVGEDEEDINRNVGEPTYEAARNYLREELRSKIQEEEK